MLTKSKGALAASALAIAAVGGGSVAVVRAMSSGPETAAPIGLPAPAGPGATAALPSGGGSGDGAVVSSLPAGGGETAGGQSGTAGAGQAGTGQPTAGGIPAGVKPTSWLPAAAGQGQAGPLPAGALPADGAVPGALPGLRALAAERQATTALPHSPQLLAELDGGQGARPGTATAGASTAGQPAAGAGGSSSPATASTSPVAATSAAATSTAATSASATSTAATSAAAASAAASPEASGSATGSPAGSGSATGSPVVAGSATPGTGAPGSAAATAQAGVGPGLSPAATTRAPARLAGLDVAGFQHPVTKQYPQGTPVSWSKVAAAGYRYVAIKATEGDYYVNPWAASDLTGAKAAGLDVTPYHFAIPNANGGAPQARFAVEYSGYATGRQMLPLLLDIEYDPYVNSDHTNMCYGLTARQMTAWVGGFVNEVKTLTGQYPVIYTTANWWNTCTGGSTAFAADPMWVAAYGFTSPPMPAGWHNWMFWQYSSGGTVPGVATAKGTDVDYFSPLMVGLLDPGSQAVKTRAQVTVSVASLGALAGEALKYSAHGLPPGLSVTAKGAITGVVAAAAAQLLTTAYSVRLAVTNAAGETETTTFTWIVTPTCARSIKESPCRGG